ncbi:MAG: DNA polymerase III subunit gamma/tau [Prevotellaceae bacterium]|jgi:DNA polymerase-3 subunit gamma/tau|nr:DNA polymerase III subunit gamma/tau [Prevotellaceae bacterium]
MSEYIVSARKYRPSTFMSVVGQRSLTTTLKNAILGNHLAHAYLFCGPRGVGKTTCARIFAKTINCQNRTPEGEACNVCESCKGFNEQRSYNIHELDAASNNSVEDIRSLVEQVRIPPQIGKYSVYIIDEVHMLSSAAFNAFLKTLEEPPAHAIFILATTEKHKIIPTILSRCQIYDFNRITITDTVEHLQYIAEQEGITVEKDALNIIAQKADGGMRDALSIFDQIVSFCGNNITYKAVIENLNVLDYEYYFRLTDTLLSNDVFQSMLIFNDILSKGFEAQHFITGLASHFRDLLMCRDAATVVLIEVGDNIRQRYADQAQRTPQEFLFKAIEIANECDLNYRVSRNKRLLVELALIRLSQLTAEKKNFDSVEKPVVAPVFSVPTAASPQPVPQPAAAGNAGADLQPVPNTTAILQPIQAGAGLQPVPNTTAGLQPAQKPTAAAPSRMMPKSISINNNVSSTIQPNLGAEPQPAPAVQSAPQQRDTPFSQETLSKAWETTAKSLNKEVHIVKFIENAVPVFETGNRFILKVENDIQNDTVESNKGEILQMLKNNLQNDFVDFSIQVEENTVQKVLTPQDRFNKMLADNESFRKLAGDLNLEIA